MNFETSTKMICSEGIYIEILISVNLLITYLKKRRIKAFNRLISQGKSTFCFICFLIACSRTYAPCGINMYFHVGGEEKKFYFDTIVVFLYYFMLKIYIKK